MDGELLDVVSSDEESAAVEENDRHTWSTAAEQPRENEDAAEDGGKLLPSPPAPPSLEELKEPEEQDSVDEPDEPPAHDIGMIKESPFWCQSVVPARLYRRGRSGELEGTPNLQALHSQFEQRVLHVIRSSKEAQPRSDAPAEFKFHHSCSSCKQPGGGADAGSSSSTDNSRSDSSRGSDSDACSGVQEDVEKREREKDRKKRMRKTPRNEKPIKINAEVQRKRSHPAALHPDLSFNEPGQTNDGPLCRCSWLARQTGVRHGKFVGEKAKAMPKCAPESNNLNSLHHYVLEVSPSPGSYSRAVTSISVDGVVYEFEGFSLLFHHLLPESIPKCFNGAKLGNNGPKFEMRLVKENAPESFTVADLELFHTFLFTELLELYDLCRRPTDVNESTTTSTDSCPYYHCLPRFVRKLKDDGKEVLPMSTVLQHLTKTFSPLVDDAGTRRLREESQLFRDFSLHLKGQLVVNPAKKPACIRADLLDAPNSDNGDCYPFISHFGIMASAYTYNGKNEYQSALRALVKQRHLLMFKSHVTTEERQKLEGIQRRFKRFKAECKKKRDINVSVSSRGFYVTGLYPDVVQHALLVVLATSHVRFHCSLKSLEEENIGYVFKNRRLLELALTHPSYRINYGTNPDHAKNTLNNCGILISKYQSTIGPTGSGKGPAAEEEAKIPSARKKGINALVEIMSMQPSRQSSAIAHSSVNHNERLEFLGDAVVEFITTIHLFFMFPQLEEGGLATYRSALVQNKHLAVLAGKINLHRFMLYAHGPDLCHETDLKHAMANAFEALMAAIYLDGGIDECDHIFAKALYGDDVALLRVWRELPEHTLKRSADGDRHMIEKVPSLRLLTEFEESIGVKFRHIRVLARAFTRRNVSFNDLTLGDNQRLEFLGDTVLQLITSEYLYKHLPYHHEGHLSLLRTCLVSNKTQAVICDDLAMPKYLVVPKMMRKHRKHQQALRTKDKADLVEAFLGALYVDRGWEWCRTFCRVCFFPRLKANILTQQWNDPKSQLQQCCLALRNRDEEPDIPEYKIVGVQGPTNTRVYRAVVYFRDKRLAEGEGPTIQQAQMKAAENALLERSELFPALGVLKSDGSAGVTKRGSPRKRRKLERLMAPTSAVRGRGMVKPQVRLGWKTPGAASHAGDRPSTSRDSTRTPPVRIRAAAPFNPFRNKLLLRHLEKQKQAARNMSSTGRPRLFRQSLSADEPNGRIPKGPRVDFEPDDV